MYNNDTTMLLTPHTGSWGWNNNVMLTLLGKDHCTLDIASFPHVGPQPAPHHPNAFLLFWCYFSTSCLLSISLPLAIHSALWKVIAAMISGEEEVKLSVCFLVESIHFALSSMCCHYLYLIVYCYIVLTAVVICYCLFLFGSRFITNDIWISRIGNGESGNTEVFTTSSTEINVITSIMVNTSFR